MVEGGRCGSFRGGGRGRGFRAGQRFDGAGLTWACACAVPEKAPTASALNSINRHTAWNRACHPVNKEVFIVGSEWG